MKAWNERSGRICGGSDSMVKAGLVGGENARDRIGGAVWNQGSWGIHAVIPSPTVTLKAPSRSGGRRTTARLSQRGRSSFEARKRAPQDDGSPSVRSQNGGFRRTFELTRPVGAGHRVAPQSLDFARACGFGDPRQTHLLQLLVDPQSRLVGPAHHR